jgi:hypothetical protein
MPRDSSGTYTLPPAYNPVDSGTTITSAWANGTFNDVATALTDSLDRNGRGGMAGVFQNFDGTENAPGITWANENQSGFYRAGLADMRVSISSQDLFRWAGQSVEIWADSQWNPVLYSGSGGAIPDGTENYQTTAWDEDNSEWVPNSNLLVNYISGTVTIGGELAVGNDILVGGDVDGRDVSVDGAKLDFHTSGVTAGGEDIHFTDAPNIPGTQYAREALAWVPITAIGAVVNPGTTDGQTLKWDQPTSEWINTSDVIVTDAGFMGVGVTPTGKISTDGDVVAGIGGFGWLGNGSVGLRGLDNLTQGMFSSGLQTDIRGEDILLDDGSAEGAFLTDGRLGIGTPTPNSASTLDVNGAIYTKDLPLIDGGVTLAERFAVIPTYPPAGGALDDTIYFVTN